MRDEIEQLKNIGKKTATWLHEVGVHTRADLEQLGSVEAYKRLKALHPDRVSLNALWALEGALLNMSYTMLPQDVKAEGCIRFWGQKG